MNLVAEAKKKLQQEQLEQENKQLRQTVADLQEQMQQLSSTNERLVAELRQTAEENERAEAELAAQDKTILDLTSRESALRSEMQRMADKLVKMNEADLIVTKNEELEKKVSEVEAANRELLQITKRAEAAARNSKQEYEQQMRGLAKARSAVEEKQESLDERIAKEASEKVRWKLRSLTILDGASVGSLCLYPIFLTILTGVKEEAFRSDFGAFWKAIWKAIVFMAGLIDRAGDAAASLGDKITVPVLGGILHWMLWGVVILVLGGALLVALCWAVWKLASLYAGGDLGIYSLLDGWTLVEILASLSVVVWFAAPIRAVIPVNLVLLFLIAHAAYVGVRVLIWSIKPY